MTESTLDDFFSAARERTEQVLEQALPADAQDQTQLVEAMRYALLGGGKRIRPILTYAVAEALDVRFAQVDSYAASVEMIHAYSLIHDDLPAMDDDDFRRGRPTCHRAFNEALAVLAGDALQTCAFELLVGDATLSLEARMRMTRELLSASGIKGMVMGQAIDLAAVGCAVQLEGMQTMHRLKTGALIRAAIVGPLALVPRSAEFAQALGDYADALGLAFQIVDDILDETADDATLGKPAGSDRDKNKPTFPALLGLQGAHAHAQAQHQRAMDALDTLPLDCQRLRQLSHWLLQRTY